VGKRSRYRVRWEQSLNCRRRTRRDNGVTSGKKMFVCVLVKRRKEIYTR
jgi:hypothetical protein